jgi:hypothetical protein
MWNDRRFWLSTDSVGGLLFKRIKSKQKCVGTNGSDLPFIHPGFYRVFAIHGLSTGNLVKAFDGDCCFTSM